MVVPVTSTVTRDYVADMRAALDSFVPAGDYIAAETGAAFVAHLRDRDPGLLAGWLDTRAELLLTQEISYLRRTRRQLAHGKATRDVFHQAATAIDTANATGNPADAAAALNIFEQHLVVNGERLSRPIGKTTKADHEYVADQYEQSEKRSAIAKAFHRAVAKRIPNGGTLDQVMSPEDYLRLRASIG